MVLAEKQEDQWNRIKSPEINPQVYGQIIFGKGVKHIQGTEEILCNNWCWKATCKIIKVDYSLSPYTKLPPNGSKT